MNLISMELSAEEAKELTTPDPKDGPKYPYGLRLNLDDEALKKLGITELPAVDTRMQLTASVEVCTTSEYESQSGEQRSIDLQITALALAPESNAADAPDRLFPTMKAKA
jgi:hypothetical protein